MDTIYTTWLKQWGSHFGRMILIPVLAFSLIALGCGRQEEEGPMEKAGKKADEAMEEAGKVTKESMEEVGKEMGEAVEKGGEEMEETGQEMQEAATDKHTE